MDSGSVILLIAFVLGGAAIALILVRENRRVQAERRALAQNQAELAQKQMTAAQEELVAFSNAAVAGTLTDINAQVSGVILKAGERCFLATRSVEQVVSVKHTRYVGGSQGVSIRLMKGVSYRVGQFQGQPVVTEGERVADRGSLYVTDQRVIFTGASHVTTVLMRKVADARAEHGRVIVISENKSAPLVLVLSEIYRSVLFAGAIQFLAEKAAN